MAAHRPRSTRSSSGARPRTRPDKPESPQKALPPVDPDNGFLALGVPEPLCGALALDGITEPFPIQVSTLPDSLQGRDVLGRGRTGSGKTLAFGLAVLTRIADRRHDRAVGSTTRTAHHHGVRWGGTEPSGRSTAEGCRRRRGLSRSTRGSHRSGILQSRSRRDLCSRRGRSHGRPRIPAGGQAIARRTMRSTCSSRPRSTRAST